MHLAARALGDDEPLRLVLLAGAGKPLDNVACPADDPGVMQPPPIHLNPELAGAARG
jgi:hypothetical protein